jgi:hypothetical protein
MKRRWKILIVVAVLLGVGMLLAMMRHYQLRSATEAYIAQLEAEGEPMDLVQVLPPPIPPEQNGADLIRQATAMADADKGLLGTNFYGIQIMKPVVPGKAMVCWQQPDDKEFNTTNSWPEIADAIAQNQNSFTLLRQIIGKPHFDFKINYGAGVADLGISNLLYLPNSKRATQRLSIATICDLHDGDTASAMKNLRAMLAITKGLKDERLAISELVRLAIAQNTMFANWEILQATNLTDGQLAQLQNDWSNMDFTESMENAILMERVIGEITLTKWRDSGSKLQDYLDSEREAEEKYGMISGEKGFLAKVKTDPKIILWRYWWSYPDELRYLQGFQVFINTMRSVQTNGSFWNALQNQTEKLNELRLTNSDGGPLDFGSDDSNFHWLFSQDVLDFRGVADRVMRTEAAKRMVITAIALKRYELKHGNYPPALNSLVPGLLPAIPLDPVDGQPLRYWLKTDGTFLLYSIGPNGKDDGGNPALEKNAESSGFYWLNTDALDWVWPQPATPEEIKNFYSHLPK